MSSRRTRTPKHITAAGDEEVQSTDLQDPGPGPGSVCRRTDPSEPAQLVTRGALGSPAPLLQLTGGHTLSEQTFGPPARAFGKVNRVVFHGRNQRTELQQLITLKG